MASQYQQYLSAAIQNPAAIIFVEAPVNGEAKFRTFDQHAVLVASHCQLHHLQPVYISGHLAVDADQADIDLLKDNGHEVIIVIWEVTYA